MRYPYESRALIVLAALKMRPSEIAELREHIVRMSPSSLIDLLHSIERELLSDRRYPGLLDRPERPTGSYANSGVEQALYLLRNEASLSNAEIAKGIANQLRNEKELRAIPKYDPKKGISNWLETISEMIGPSRLLHFATVLRNRANHKGQSPVWKLDES